MPASLTRRASLMLPFLLAACGGREQREFAPLRYQYLPPIRLNVASIEIQDQFYPSGMAPDITDRDPVHPVEALRAMAQDRLQALGASGQAVFGITNASLTREDDVIICALAVELSIYPQPGIRSGFARALASRQHTGPVDDLRATLYDVTKATMDAMNVEFEYQVRRNLAPWVLSASATPSPVQQQPLDTGPGGPPPTEAPPMQPPGGAPPTQMPPPAGGPPMQMPPPAGAPPMPPPAGTPPAPVPLGLPPTPSPQTPPPG